MSALVECKGIDCRLGGRLVLSGTDLTVAQRESVALSRLPAEGLDLELTLAEYERGLLAEAMNLAGGVKKRAAQLLSISFRSFRYRHEKLGLDDDSSHES